MVHVVLHEAVQGEDVDARKAGHDGRIQPGDVQGGECLDQLAMELGQPADVRFPGVLPAPGQG